MNNEQYKHMASLSRTIGLGVFGLMWKSGVDNNSELAGILGGLILFGILETIGHFFLIKIKD
jgi:hypothetical protein